MPTASGRYADGAVLLRPAYHERVQGAAVPVLTARSAWAFSFGRRSVLVRWFNLCGEHL